MLFPGLKAGIVTVVVPPLVEEELTVMPDEPPLLLEELVMLPLLLVLDEVDVVETDI